jgi:hypothetical protein
MKFHWLRLMRREAIDRLEDASTLSTRQKVAVRVAASGVITGETDSDGRAH